MHDFCITRHFRASCVLNYHPARSLISQAYAIIVYYSFCLKMSSTTHTQKKITNFTFNRSSAPHFKCVCGELWDVCILCVSIDRRNHVTFDEKAHLTQRKFNYICFFVLFSVSTLSICNFETWFFFFCTESNIVLLFMIIDIVMIIIWFSVFVMRILSGSHDFVIFFKEIIVIILTN